MSTTPQAQAAATARQRLAGVLGTLQQDPNIPSNILEIVSGLAGAIGPLFKLERGDPDSNLFIQARGVLQQTLEKMQGVDQNFPGVADATQAIADTLRTIFNALKDAQAAQAAPQAAPAVVAQAAPQVAPQAQPFAQPAQQPFAQPVQQAPVMQQPAAPPQPIAAPIQPQRSATPGPFAAPPSAQPQPQAQAPNPYATPSPGSLKGSGPNKSPSGVFRAPPAATVPMGPTGLPKLETEVNVHSESNFFTDFFGDIRNNGGVFVATFHMLPVGTVCEVSLAFPGNLSADIRGEVKWARNASDGTSPGLGITITNANPDAWGLIERFVKKREPIMHEM